MNRDEFDTLVKRLEAFAEDRPCAYFARVVLLAALGYFVWWIVLGGLLAILVFLGWLTVRFPHQVDLKLIIFGGLAVMFFMATILRSIRVRIDPPGGFEVHRSQSPQLFALLDEVSQKLACARFHHVLLTSDYNAMVVQVPRLGVLGWQRNFLILGLPLLQGLSPEQLRAVVAHEFAHLSGNHTRFGCWIYRVRRSWEQVLNRMLAEQHPGAGFLFKFFRWYAPYFNAYTFVLARANEYEADSWAARLTGSEIAGQALCQVQIHNRLLEESFWPETMRLAVKQEQPEIGAFHRLRERLQAGLEPHSARKWLRQSLAAETNNADTHPCLRDRLQALGWSLGASAPASASASACAAADDSLQPPPLSRDRGDALLGETLPACVRALEIRWENAIKTQWRQRYLRAQKGRQRLEELQNYESARSLMADEYYKRATITMNLKGEAAAIPLLHRVLELAPGHAQANFLLGRTLIRDDNAAGIEPLEKAIAQDPDAVMVGLDLLYGYYGRMGRLPQLRELEKRCDENQDTLRFARAERDQIHLSDTFLPHALSTLQMEEILKQLRDYSEIQRAYLVRKELSFFPQKPLYVLVVETNGAGLTSGFSAEDQSLINRLAENLRLPGQTLIFMPTGRMETVGRIIRSAAWTRVYEKASRKNAA
ncbi:MAG TPA: M48 family metalloprotease [Verrucomicrobiae bacterium]|nr:M48 family metalloprotease [Verrucomicrobiae bacterium]